MRCAIAAAAMVAYSVVAGGTPAAAQLDLSVDAPDYSFDDPGVMPLPGTREPTAVYEAAPQPGPAIGSERRGAIRENILSDGRVDVFVEPQVSIDPEVDVPAASVGITIRLDE